MSLGLYAYPALMAADILLYHATHVPVGEDQKQHVELTRDIAAKFNHDYGVDFFSVTEPVIEGVPTRVMSLRDGSKKMSKSDPSDMSRINLTDDADAIVDLVQIPVGNRKTGELLIATEDRDARSITYCGGGIAATLDAYLLHQLGYENIAVYDNSMSEWSTDDSLPIETG